MGIVVRHSRWAVAPVAAGLVLLMLLGAIGVGLRVPGFAFLSGLPGFGLLDYRTLSGSAFAPLRADYLDELLGTGFGQEGVAPPAAPGGDGGSSTADRLALDALPPLAPFPDSDSERAPVVLDHAFTNNDFDRAVVVPSLPFTARTSTAGATMEPGEPTSCSTTGGTAWYRYTPSRTRMVFADTFGTKHATAIGVFRGPARLSALQQEACGSDPTGNASIGFSAQAGTTYYLQVAVTSVVRGGPLVFHLSPLGTTARVPTLAREGVEHGQFPAVSGDGRYVAFTSLGAPTCPVVTCDAQLLLADRRSGAVTLVSRTPDGRPGNGNSAFPSLSHDGRYVGFSSSSGDLVPGDSNNGTDYFVHDRMKGRTVRASVSSAGRESRYENASDSAYSTFGSLSPDGRYAVFNTAARGLAAGDDDDLNDVYVRDLRTGRTTWESMSAADFGRPQHAGTGALPVISRGGRYVMFQSFATDLVRADYGGCAVEAFGCANVFVRDRHAGMTSLLTRTLSGRADNQARRFSMSYDGQVRAWTSLTSDIVPGDTNQVSDVFLHDARTRRTVRVSVTSSGEQQTDPGSPTQYTDALQVAGTSRYVSLSADGRYVAFDSRSPTLVPKDNNGASDIFVHDVLTGATLRTSVSSRGDEGNADSLRPAMSADGNVVVFQSDADNLADDDDDKTSDIYVHDRRGA